MVQQRQPGQKQFQHRQLRRLRRAAQRIGQFRPAAPQPLIAQLRQLLRVGFPFRQRRQDAPASAPSAPPRPAGGLAVTASAQTIQLTQAGLQFSGTPQGVATASQRVGIRGTGQAPLQWTAEVQTLSGGDDWLRVTPGQGTHQADHEEASAIQLSVNPTGLAPGPYYGTVRVAAANAANSPQAVMVRLDVVDPATEGAVVVHPAGELLVESGGAEVSLINLSSRAMNYTVAAGTEDGANWLQATAQGPAVVAGGTSRITVRTAAGLTPGVRRGVVRVSLTAACERSG